MDIQVTLSEQEAEQLKELSSALEIDTDETIRTMLRTHLSAGRTLSFSPGQSLSYEEAVETVLSCIWSHKGTFMQLRLGNDPGETAISRLLSALRLLWHRYREKTSIPNPICHAAASILHFRDEAKSNLLESGSEARYRLLESLAEIGMAAFNLLSGANADSNEVCRTDLGERAGSIDSRPLEP